MFRRRSSGRQQASTEPLARSTAPAVAPSEPAPIPESATTAWKQRVEAEARRRLKGELHGAGGARH